MHCVVCRLKMLPLQSFIGTQEFKLLINFIEHQISKLRMVHLKDIKRPPLALIKIVEAIGILLRIPKTSARSAYRAPTPTNYDATIDILTNDFYGTLNQLNYLESSGIPNDIASDLFAKTQEPSFDYEAAIQIGGLETRDLFNTLMLILDQLKEDSFRIPVRATNVLVLIDGTRSSYIAFDAATHILNHGVCHVAAIIRNDSQIPGKELVASHICEDLTRRTREQYKIPEHCFKVVSIPCQVEDDMVDLITQYMDENNCKILVLGIDRESSCGWTQYLSKFALWAAWESIHTVVMAKSCSRIRPFPLSHTQRKFVACAKEIQDLKYVFNGALELLRPEDTIILVGVVQPADPIGDARETRFDMGMRFNWINNEDEDRLGPVRPGWNDDEVEKFRSYMEDLLGKSQASGYVRIERKSPVKTIGQELIRVAQEEAADFLVMRRGLRNHVSEECLTSARCSIVFTV